MLRVTTTTKQTKETVVASSVTTSRTSEEYTLTRVSSEPFADAAVNDRDGSPHPTTSSRRSSTRKIRHDSKSTKYIPAEIDLSHLGSMSPSQHATDSNGENAPSIVVTTTAAEDEGRESTTQQGSGKSAVVHRVNSQRNPIPHHPTPETPVIKTNSINVGNKPASPTRFLGTPTNSGVANKHQSGHLAPALGVPGTGEPQWSVATSALDLPARHPHVRHGPSNVTNAHDTQDASAPYGEKVLGEDISGRPLNVAIPTPNDPYIGTHPQTRAKDARPSASRNPFFMGMIHGLVLNVFGFLGYFWNRSPRFPIGVLVGLGLCMMVVAIVLFAASTATGVVNAAIVLIVVGFVTACLGLSLLLCVRSK